MYQKNYNFKSSFILPPKAFAVTPLFSMEWKSAALKTIEKKIDSFSLATNWRSQVGQVGIIWQTTICARKTWRRFDFATNATLTVYGVNKLNHLCRKKNISAVSSTNRRFTVNKTWMNRAKRCAF